MLAVFNGNIKIEFKSHFHVPFHEDCMALFGCCSRSVAFQQPPRLKQVVDVTHFAEIKSASTSQMFSWSSKQTYMPFSTISNRFKCALTPQWPDIIHETVVTIFLSAFQLENHGKWLKCVKWPISSMFHCRCQHQQCQHLKGSTSLSPYQATLTELPYF
jgi:hypothetical protein